MARAGDVFGRCAKFHSNANLVDQIARHWADDVAAKNAVGLCIGEDFHGIEAISIGWNDEVRKARKAILMGIEAVNDESGVLILTDMFGGTPSNLSYSFLEEGRIEVISGVNLPILIRAASARKNQTLSELATNLESFGKKSISLASGILKGNKRS